LKKYKPEIVITEFSFKYLTFWLLFLLRRIYGYHLILWSHGISNREQNNPLKSVRSRINLAIYRKADALIVYSDKRAGTLKKFIDPGKIYIAHNTINMERNLEIQNNLLVIGKVKLREELGFKEKYHVVYSGRLTSNKRIDLLINVFRELKQKDDIALHIIGTGPELYKLEKAQTDSGNIYLHGEIYDEEKAGKYIFASDLMIITGAVGLSILHAFSLSIPLVACNPENGNPQHGPEIELLKHNQNGLLSEQDINIMADNIYRILSDLNTLKKMQGKALLTAKENSVENMVSGFRNAIIYLGYSEKMSLCAESAG
jgi:glycosyltransferase involved in cell wall biosynthesis